MGETAIRLSKLLREEKGCDLIIALTHSRVSNDLTLAEEVGAVSGLKEDAGHGADLILGGHE
jgi:5'-nucleotidase